MMRLHAKPSRSETVMMACYDDGRALEQGLASEKRTYEYLFGEIEDKPTKQPEVMTDLRIKKLVSDDSLEVTRSTCLDIIKVIKSRIDSATWLMDKFRYIAIAINPKDEPTFPMEESERRVTHLMRVMSDEIGLAASEIDSLEKGITKYGDKLVTNKSRDIAFGYMNIWLKTIAGHMIYAYVHMKELNKFMEVDKMEEFVGEYMAEMRELLIGTGGTGIHHFNELEKGMTLLYGKFTPHKPSARVEKLKTMKLIRH